MTSIIWLYGKMFEKKGIITFEEFEQAKEMHKQEIIDAHLDGQSLVSCKDEYAEKYYQETFKLCQ